MNWFKETLKENIIGTIWTVVELICFSIAVGITVGLLIVPLYLADAYGMLWYLLYIVVAPIVIVAISLLSTFMIWYEGHWR